MSAPIHEVLLKYQREWIGDRAQVRVCEKSRRAGISWATAAEAVMLSAAAPNAGGKDTWYVGYTQDMGLQFVRDAAFWAKHFKVVASEIATEDVLDDDRSIKSFTIVFSSGFRITALSSAPRNLRSKKGFVVIDEAAFHNELDELIESAIALKMWGGRIAIISTHNGVDNPFNELVEDVKAKKLNYALHHIPIDRALEDGLFKRICLVEPAQYGAWTAEKERAWLEDLHESYREKGVEQELYCVPKNSGGAYIARSLIEACSEPAPVVRLDLQKEGVEPLPEPERAAWVAPWCEKVLAPVLATLNRDRPHYFGMDFGRVADLSVIAPMVLGQTLERRVPFLVELRRCPYRQQEQILKFIVERLPRFTAGALDATGNGKALAEYAADNFGSLRIEQVTLSDAWYSEHLPPFRAAFQDRTIVVPRDSDVLDDLRALESINGVPKLPKAKNKGDDGKSRHGDSAVALALAYRASFANVAPIEFRSTGEKRQAQDEPARTSGRGFGMVRGALNLLGWN
jgi:phage FluMu gp28-like protein